MADAPVIKQPNLVDMIPNIVIVGSECPELVAACKMIPAETMENALELAGNKLGKSCQVLIVPHAMLTLPVIQPSPR